MAPLGSNIVSRKSFIFVTISCVYQLRPTQVGISIEKETNTEPTMASARLRKTFKYPSDDEDSGGASRDEMDEEGELTYLQIIYILHHDTDHNRDRTRKCHILTADEVNKFQSSLHRGLLVDATNTHTTIHLLPDIQLGLTRPFTSPQSPRTHQPPSQLLHHALSFFSFWSRREGTSRQTTATNA